MITINYKGRFGNNMFQYAFGRIISYETSQFIEKYKGEKSEYFKNIQSSNNEKKKLKEKVCIRGKDEYSINYIIKNYSDHHIHLDGYFQNKDYYLPYKNKISEWFYLPPLKNSFASDEDVILHVRRSDFLKIRENLPLQFYSKVLNKNNFKNIYIIGAKEDIDNTTRNFFKKYNPIYLENKNPIESFKIIQSFKNIIQSKSTFCWWACFLSKKAQYIYTPVKTNSSWDNLIINEEKYINVPV